MKRIILLGFIASAFFHQTAIAQCTGNPSVTNTTSASSITSTTATLNGNLDGNAGASCNLERGFYYSTSSGVSSSDPKVSETGTFAQGAYSLPVTGLNPGTRYFIRSFAINVNGSDMDSNDDDFYTLSTTPTQLTSGQFTISNISSTQMTLNVPNPSTLGAYGYLLYVKAGSAPTVPALTDGSAPPGGGDLAATLTTGSTYPVVATPLNPETRYFFTFVPFGYNGANSQTYAYNTTSLVTKDAFTLATEPDDQPDEALTAVASSPINVNLGFPENTGNGVTGDDLYVILRNLGSAPDVTTLIDGQAPTASAYHLHTTSSSATTAYADGTVLPNKTYHYALIPFAWDGTNTATINYRTTAGADPIRVANVTTPSSTVTLAGLTTGGSNGLSTTFTGGTTDQGVLGFSLTSANGPYTFNGVAISINNDPAGKLLNFELVASTDATLGNGDDISLGNQAPTVGSPSTVTWSALARAHAISTTYYYFLRVDPDPANTVSTPLIISFNQGNLSLADGTAGAASVSRSINADPTTTTIGSLNAGANNIAASPMVGGSTGRGIFGFSLTSTGTQTVSLIKIAFDVDPTPFLQNFSLVSSGDADFNTANTNIPLDATPSVSGSGPYLVTFDPTTNLTITTTSNYFVVADVKPGVTTATSVFQPSLAAADITISPGIASGSAIGTDYALDQLTTSIASLNGLGNPNNISPSPLIATQTGRGIFGFSLTSNGSQSISLIRVRFDADPTPYLQNYSLVTSADDDFSTANSTVALDATAAITGTGPWFLDFDPTVNFSLSNSTTNFFVVADVKAGAATTASAFQASITVPDVSVNQGVVASSATGLDYSITGLSASISSLNAIGSPNFLSPSPLVAGTTARGIFGFSLTSNGSQNVSLVEISFDSDPTPFLENFQLVTSGDVDYSTANAAVGVTPAAAVTGSGPYILTFDPTVNVDISNTTVNFFVVANVKSSAVQTVSAFQPSIAAANIGVNQGSVTGTAVGNDYDIDDVRATIASLNTTGGPNNITASPLVGGTQNAGVLGFSIASNGNQNISAISVQFDANPSAFLQNFELYTSADVDFSTANTLLPLSGAPVVSGTGPFYVTFTPATPVALSISTVNFFAVADVLPTVTTTASAFQASLTSADFTVDTGNKTGSSTGNDYSLTQLTATIASLNIPATHNVSTSPMVGGSLARGIFGFSLTSNGTQTVSAISIRFDADPSLYLQTFSLVSSADADFATANTPIALSGAPTVTGVGPFFLNFTPTVPINISNGTSNFFISADVKPGVPTLASAFQASLTSTDFTISQGFRAGSATGVDYSLTQLTATIASLNATGNPNNVAASPLVGGTTGAGIFGFSLGSNGNQTVSQIRVQFNVDPSAYLQNFSLVQSADVDYSTANTPVALASAPTVTGVGPFVLTINPSSAINIGNTTLNFFLVADVKPTISTASNVFTPSLGSTDISINQGFSAGSSVGNTYSLAQLTITVTQLTTGIAPSPLSAGTAGTTSANAIIGFSIASNGNQTASSISISLDQNPATRFTSYALVVSGDNSFTSTGDNAVVPTSSINVTGAGPYTVTFTTTAPQNLSSAKNYFIVASISPAVNTTTLPAITPSFSTGSNLVFNQGFITANAFAGSSYTFVPSQTSTITFNGGSNSTNIAYGSFQSSAALTWGGAPNSVSLGTFTINDVADPDNQGTTLTDLQFSLSNVGDLREIAIFDGGTSGSANIAQQPAGALMTFSGLSLAAADGGTKQFTIRATFNAPVIDKQNHQIIITQATASVNGSNFAAADAGAATTGNGATVNNVVVTATRLRFLETMPLTAEVNLPFTLTARAVDVLNSVDIDETSSVTVSVSGGPGGFTGGSEGATQNLVQGVYQWTGLIIDLAGTYALSGNHATFSGGNDATGTLEIQSLGVLLTTADLNLCPVGAGSFYQTLGPITLDERDPSDIRAGTNLTFLLILPTGFEFRTTGATPVVNFTASQNITSVSSISYVGNTIAKFTYSVVGQNLYDDFTITGLQVKNNNAAGVGDILRSGTGVIKGAEEDVSHGVLTPTPSTTVDFGVQASPNQNAIAATETNFSIFSAPIILNGQIPAGNNTTLGTFSGPGVSYKLIGNPINANRYVFNPSTLNVGSYDITYTYTDGGTGCTVSLTKTFTVYASAITNLEGQYCANDNTPKALSINPTFIPANYTAPGDYALLFYSYKFMTDVVVNPTSVTITVPNHGLESGQTYGMFIGYGFTGPAAPFGYISNNFSITNVTTNTFDINIVVGGAWDRRYGEVYLNNPTITNAVQNGLNLTLTTNIKHGLQNGAKIRIGLNWTSGPQTYDWFTVSNVNASTNQFDITATAPALATFTSGFMDIFIYRISSFTPTMAATLNSSLAGDANYYVGYFIRHSSCSATSCDSYYNFQNVTLNPLPIVDFTGLSANYCSDDATVVNLTGTNPTYDGTFSISPNLGLTDGGVGSNAATFVAATPGITQNSAIAITYSFTDTKNCTNSITKQTTVRSLPTVNAGANLDMCETDPDGVQLGGTVALPTAAGNGPFVYSWDNSLSLTTGDDVANPMALPASTTTYTVTVTDFYSCVKTDQIQVTVFNGVDVNAVAPTSICGGNTGGISLSGSTITGAVTTGTWSTLDGGTFQTSGNAVDDDFGSAVKFIPTANSGTVTLKLESDVPPTSPCPATSDIVVVTINPNAAIQFPPSVPFEFCANDQMLVNATVTLGANPYGNIAWSHTGNGSFDNAGNILATYVPSPIEINNGATLTLTLTAIDSDGPTGPCLDVTANTQLIIAPRPLVNAGPDIEICASTIFEDGIPISLAGSISLQNGTLAGSWSGGSNNFPGGNTNPATTYLPTSDVLTTGRVEVLTLTSADPASECEAESDEVTITIRELPPAPSPGLNPISKICVGQSVPALETFGTGLIKWYTTIDETAQYTKKPSNQVGQNSPFNTGASNTIDNSFDYYATQTLYIDAAKLPNGCQSPPTLIQLIVNPLPTPDFNIEDVCKGDFTKFTDLSSVTYHNANVGRTWSIDKYTWNFKNGTTIGPDLGTANITGSSSLRGTYKNPEFQYADAGVYDVLLTVLSSDGCENSILASNATFGINNNNDPLEIGILPVADFAFVESCRGDDTQFDYLQTANPAASSMKSFEWNYGDPGSGTSNIFVSTNPASPEETHRFTGEGTYPVTLTLTTDLDCKASVTKSVFILPYITDFTQDYIADFVAGPEGWIHEGLARDFASNTVPDGWTLGTPNGTVINSSFPNSSGNSWLIKPAGKTERSVLYGPCINVSNLDKPALSFAYWNNTESGQDGVYVEYSDDNGRTWRVMGDNASGLDWYNATGIKGLASQNNVVYPGTVGQGTEQYGFTGTTPNVGPAQGWRVGKFSLDPYATQTKLRVRFVFGTNGSPSTLDGFALDYFRLSSRNRLVLVENFTNTSAAAAANNTAFEQFKSGITNSELVKLQYHSGLLGEDEINSANKVDPNARGAFYGLTNTQNSIPRAFIDGRTSDNGNATFTNLTWTENTFSARALAIAPFNLTVANTAADPGALNISVSGQANENLSIGKPVLIVAVVEKTVNNNSYVVRKLLPSAAGIPIVLPLAKDQALNIPEISWSINVALEASDLALVAFIQDQETREVYQAAVHWTLNPAPQLITGLEGQAEASFKVYPNPADKEMTIELPESVVERAEMRMFDQVGKVVNRASFEKGERKKTIDTSTHAGGVYLMQVETAKGILTRKVMVLHGR